MSCRASLGRCLMFDVSQPPVAAAAILDKAAGMEAKQ